MNELQFLHLFIGTVGVSTQLGLGQFQFEVRSTHPDYQQHWRHCNQPAGPLGRCDPLLYLSHSYCQTLSFFLRSFACLHSFLLSFFPLFNFAHPLVFLSTLYIFFTSHRHIFFSLSSLTFSSISFIFYLALTEATGMKTYFSDTWPHFFSHWYFHCLCVCACVWLQLSLLSPHSPQWFSDQCQLYQTAKRRMQYFSVTSYSCKCVFVYGSV